MNFNTPILFLVFNRPKYTKEVFEAIRSIKPKQLFIAADGEREQVPEDKENCILVKEIVSHIDWDCEVKTLYRETNLGCGIAVSSAITWFFEQVEMGIILEDDCLPSPSFFPFCQEMLERYKDDTRISLISGTNLMQQWKRADYSYVFSNQSGIWGWATWKRAWDNYDYLISKWEHQEVKDLFKVQFNNTIQRDFYCKPLDTFFNEKEASTWDYQWVFSRVINSQFGIIPAVNLISNIGFGKDATHTFEENSSFSKLAVEDLIFPLNHPKAIMIDQEYDKKLVDDFFIEKPVASLKSRIINKLNLILK